MPDKLFTARLPSVGFIEEVFIKTFAHEHEEKIDFHVIFGFLGENEVKAVVKMSKSLSDEKEDFKLINYSDGGSLVQVCDYPFFVETLVGQSKVLITNLTTDEPKKEIDIAPYYVADIAKAGSMTPFGWADVFETRMNFVYLLLNENGHGQDYSKLKATCN